MLILDRKETEGVYDRRTKIGDFSSLKDCGTICIANIITKQTVRFKQNSEIGEGNVDFARRRLARLPDNGLSSKGPDVKFGRLSAV